MNKEFKQISKAIKVFLGLLCKEVKNAQFCTCDVILLEKRYEEIIDRLGRKSQVYTQLIFILIQSLTIYTMKIVCKRSIIEKYWL